MSQTPSLAYAADDAGDEPSESKTVKTVEYVVQDLKAPAGLKISKTAKDSLTVTWTRDSKLDVRNYQVRLSRNKSMKGATTKELNSKTSSYTFKKLWGTTKYYVQVRMKAVPAVVEVEKEVAEGEVKESIKPTPSASWSSWSSAKSAKTKEPGRKDLLKIANKSTSGKSLKTFNTDYKLSKTKAGKKLIKQVKKLDKSHKVSIVMIDLKTGQGFSCASTRSMYSASCLKGPYVAALNKYYPKSVRERWGTLTDTVVESNNDTYKSLRNIYGSGCMSSFMRYSDVSGFNASSKYTWVTPRDLTKLWVGCYWYFYKDTNSNSKRCRNLYTHGNEAFIYSALKGKRTVNTKPGWYPPGHYLARNDAGIVFSKVNGQSRPYLLCVMTGAYNNVSDLRSIVRSCDAVHTDMLK